MLSGRYPSDEFAELRPRVTWDRVNGLLSARQGAKRVAIANAGTIPDRGLYGVFLRGAERDRARVGELDEEMVFEARVGETFLLGASSWRIEEITHDRVLVSPAPGEPGKMPFWKGEAGGRPIELGTGDRQARARAAPPASPTAAQARLERRARSRRARGRQPAAVPRRSAARRRRGARRPDAPHRADARRARRLARAGRCRRSAAASTRRGRWRSAPRIRDEPASTSRSCGATTGSSCGSRRRDAPPDHALLLPDPDEVEALILRQLGSTALFAARFREAAGRALLLPRRRPGTRTPLWQQRKRAADLLAVASRYGSFPIILETYRECLRDVFDLPALVDVLRRIRSRSLRVVAIESRTPSPFAASLLFSYVANYIYDGDAPLAERRAQALSVDQAQLRELIGDAELRDLLDAAAIETVEADLQHLPARFHARSADAVHDLLLRLGDLTRDEIAARTVPAIADAAIAECCAARRAVELPIAGDAAVRRRRGRGALSRCARHAAAPADCRRRCSSRCPTRSAT